MSGQIEEKILITLMLINIKEVDYVFNIIVNKKGNQ